jgi:hypothetical protein
MTYVPLGSDFAVLNAETRTDELQKITDAYEAYLGALLDFGATEKALFGETNEAYGYTTYSGRFNRPLRLPYDIVLKHKPPENYSEDQMDIKMRELFSDYQAHPISKGSDKFHGPEGDSYSAYKKEFLAKFHSLWQIFALSPPLPFDIHVLRAVAHPKFLPHRLGGKDDDTVQPGDSFFDQAFVSTTLQGPDAYKTGILSAFFNWGKNCCMMSLTVAKGTPVLPVLVKPALSAYPAEKEIVLPPNCVYVYRAAKDIAVGSYTITLYHFDVFLH